MNRVIYDTLDTWGTFHEVSSKTPNFNKLRKLGQRLPIKDYDWWRQDGQSPRVMTYNGLRSDRDVGNMSSLRSVFLNGQLSNGLMVVKDNRMRESIQQVTNRVLEKVRDSDVNLGVALGEHRETAAFVSSAMLKTARSYKQLRRGDVSGALQTLTGRRNNAWKDIPGVASNTWLAYSYGLRPLLADVHGACEALDKRGKPFVPVKSVRSSTSGSVTLTADSYSGKSRYVRTVTGQYKTRAEVRFMVSNPLVHSLDSVGLTNPLAIAWELVPFSFVVDWFVPVGKFITGIVPPQGVQFVDGWISLQARGAFYGSTSVPSTPTTSPGWNTSCQASEVLKYRRILSGFPRYHLVVPDVSLSRTQIASGLALLWQTAARFR
ncbi:TPA_asm: maturation protein [ssRNA phage SRR7976325_13]|uniref:Maturation protein n=1 Tax=ssRNA phage SRR7976325_13 TaxID=2786700 RepID=A0A8S5L247_9VIRU|nr:maturation protein [ssRNA phage SRR7976325_13]DAD51194.1 TPA_asm: maturation protein [ssRNA phage SRR7976325_13]